MSEKCFCHVKDRETGEVLAVKDAVARDEIDMLKASVDNGSWTRLQTPITLREWLINNRPSEVMLSTEILTEYNDRYSSLPARLVRTELAVTDVYINLVYEGPTSVLVYTDSGYIDHKVGYLTIEIGQGADGFYMNWYFTDFATIISSYEWLNSDDATTSPDVSVNPITFSTLTDTLNGYTVKVRAYK